MEIYNINENTKLSNNSDSVLSLLTKNEETDEDKLSILNKQTKDNSKKKKKIYGPFLWIGFSCLKASATLRRQFTFYH